MHDYVLWGEGGEGKVIPRVPHTFSGGSTASWAGTVTEYDIVGKLTQSISRCSKRYDNAQAESFFSRFKPEADMRIFDSVAEARSEAFDYIDCYYNRVRLRSTLGATIPKCEQRLSLQNIRKLTVSSAGR